MKLLPRLVLLAAVAPPAYSQSVLYTFDGDSTWDYLGASVSDAGDVNGDGYADVIVGAYADDNNGTQSGSARVFSGLDGSVLYSFDGDSAGDYLGVSVSGAGDVNGDGYSDLLVGAPFDNNNGTWSGSARVFSGADGSVLYTFDGDSGGDLLGLSVSGAGDVNGDGYADLIVGAPYDDNNGEASGSARVFSGVDGSVLYTFHGDASDDEFGYSVSGTGDVNGDGFDDMIVGAYADDNNGTDSGSVRVFSGVDGSVLYTFDGDASGDEFGYSVSGAGDVNGDGFDDLIAGSAYGLKGTTSGSARVFSGVDGSVLYTFHGDSYADAFGFSVSGAGDVNGDGFADVIVGAGDDDYNGSSSGTARVFSGADGKALWTFYGDSSGDHFGYSVSGAGDVSGDGYADLIVGALWADNSANDSGSARVFSGWSPVGTSYCGPAVPNSSGLLGAILALGSVTVTDDLLWLHATDLPLKKLGYFLVSETQGFVANPGGSQGNLCLSGQIGRFSKHVQKSGPGGNFTIQVNLKRIPTTPPHTVVAGETWNFQAWFRDKNPGPTSNFTDAVSVLFK